LVEWQLRVASGEKLPLKQEELKINGWAMEARLYAENPDAGFLPSTGKLEWLYAHSMYDDAPRVRFDSAVEQGDAITSYYDPMIAKLIVHGKTRDRAVELLRDACAVMEVAPVKTNAGFLVRCLSHHEFVEGGIDTQFLAKHGDSISSRPVPSAKVKAAAAAHMVAMSRKKPGVKRAAASSEEAASPWGRLEGFRLNGAPSCDVRLLLDGKSVVVQPAQTFELKSSALRSGAVVVFDRGEAYEFTLDTGEAEGGELAAGDGAILSPMPGKIVSVATKAGAKLKKGDPILVLEAMKMEHTLTAPFDGKLTELNAKPGAQVSEGVLLAKLEKD